MRRALAAAALGVTLLASASASAFCRTRTKGVAPDYDAVANGCSEEGLPLFWLNACVGYSITAGGSKKISYDDAANNLSQAFTRWTGASCPADPAGHTRPSIDVRDLGPVACDKVEYHGKVPNQNLIVFRDDSWNHGDKVLGLTTVNYAPSTGELYGADMELNTYGMDPLKVGDPVGPNDYDFLSVVTHEAGHFLGMGHSNVEQSTMYASYHPGQTVQRDLRPDDIEAICSIYRPDGTRTVLNTQVSVAPQCDPTPRGGYTHECYEKPGCAMAPKGSRAPLGGLAFGALLLGLRRRARR
jgi:hypothetical protein